MIKQAMGACHFLYNAIRNGHNNEPGPILGENLSSGMENELEVDNEPEVNNENRPEDHAEQAGAQQTQDQELRSMEEDKDSTAIQAASETSDEQPVVDTDLILALCVECLLLAEEQNGLTYLERAVEYLLAQNPDVLNRDALELLGERIQEILLDLPETEAFYHQELYPAIQGAINQCLTTETLASQEQSD